MKLGGNSCGGGNDWKGGCGTDWSKYVIYVCAWNSQIKILKSPCKRIYYKGRH